MVAARAKVLAACKANHKFFLNTMTTTDVIDMIKEGVRIGPAVRRQPKSAANTPSGRCPGSSALAGSERRH